MRKVVIYVVTDHPILTKCAEVFMKTHCRNTYDTIEVKTVGNLVGSYETENPVLDKENPIVLKYGLNDMREMKRTLKLKEKCDVWLLSVRNSSTVLTNGDVKKFCTLVLNKTPSKDVINFRIIRPQLKCSSNRDHNLKCVFTLNENLKTLMKSNKVFKY